MYFYLLLKGATETFKLTSFGLIETLSLFNSLSKALTSATSFVSLVILLEFLKVAFK